ncbi:hypothetical protein GQ44DRAFT_697346 [Phaeosphaeriaceae sp. PMI808]|nr:hypothetical protein GQ44DRAFT_697346 [Phaeosphaeriaceae sp. PMI808]
MSASNFVFEGDDLMNKVDLEDDMTDIDIASNGDGEDELMNEVEMQDDSDNEFKLDGYDDLGIEEDSDEDAEVAKGYDDEPDDIITGQKRKRVKHTKRSIWNREVGDMDADNADAENAEAFILKEGNAFVSKPSSRIPGTFGRTGHKKGDTMPAYHKRVTHELDSDDDLMMVMREKGFSDRQIAERLAKDGRIRYDQKSISTRISRIRLAQASNVDFLLQEGYKEWEFEDDCLLMRAADMADIEVSYEMERIRAWRFRKMSEYMRRLNKDALFSATACRERYKALVEGTGRIPTELDDDPDACRMELEAYRESREQARYKEHAIKNAKDALDRKTKNAARIKNAQKAEETAHKRQQLEEAKAHRAMARAAAAQLRFQRAGENALAKAQRNAQVKKQNSTPAKKAKKANNAKGGTFFPGASAPTEDTHRNNKDRPDPRSYLSFPDLRKMCADRGLETKGKSKDGLLNELEDADDEWSFADLQKMCKSKGLDANGDKLQIKYRLALAAAQRFQSYEAGKDAAAEQSEEMDVDE